jgi:hypothetical protein
MQKTNRNEEIQRNKHRQHQHDLSRVTRGVLGRITAVSITARGNCTGLRSQSRFPRRKVLPYAVKAANTQFPVPYRTRETQPTITPSTTPYAVKAAHDSHYRCRAESNARAVVPYLPRTENSQILALLLAPVVNRVRESRNHPQRIPQEDIDDIHPDQWIVPMICDLHSSRFLRRTSAPEPRVAKGRLADLKRRSVGRSVELPCQHVSVCSYLLFKADRLVLTPNALNL